MPPGIASSIRGKRKSAARKFFPTRNSSLPFASFWKEAVFSGEGYRKIWARLRHQGIRTLKDRVLHLLRENQLLSPARHPEPVRRNPHEGTIIVELPNQMWGTDATTTFTETEGTVTVFAAIDHCTA